MKIIFQTLKGAKHPLEVSESTTIQQLKERIDAELKLGDASEQKLIYMGKILPNEQTIADVKIKANEVIVVMVSKVKTKPPTSASAGPSSTPAATPTPAPTAAPTAATPTPTPAAQPSPAAATTAATTPSPTVSAPTPVTAPAPAVTPSASAAYEESIMGLMALGFERQQAVDAMRAAYDNADRAAEYLFGPENVLRAALAQANSGGAAGTGASAGAGASGGARSAGSAATATPSPPSTGSASGPSSNDLLNLASQSGIDQASIQQLRTLLQSNPGLAPLLLQQVSQQSPELMAQLGNNPEALEQLLSGLAAGAGGGGRGRRGAPRQRAIQVTDEEKSHIDNLQSLGFSHESALAAWLICDRNEELAANYLFEHGDVNMDDIEDDLDDEDYEGAGDMDADMGGDMNEDDEDADLDGPYFE